MSVLATEATVSANTVESMAAASLIETSKDRHDSDPATRTVCAVRPVQQAAASDRIRCESVGCRRTAPAVKYPAGTIIICGKCWRVASRSARAAYRAARKRTEALEQKACSRTSRGWLIFANAEDEAAFEQAWTEEQSLWAAVKAEINEGRGGIG